MQSVKKVVLLAVAALVMAGGTAMAAGQSVAAHDADCQKDCRMLVKNCTQEVDTLPQRIERLKTEIAKGTAVYSAEELRILQEKLKAREDQLSTLTFGG